MDLGAVEGLLQHEVWPAGEKPLDLWQVSAARHEEKMVGESRPLRGRAPIDFHARERRHHDVADDETEHLAFEEGERTRAVCLD